MRVKDNNQLSLIDSFLSGVPQNKFLEKIEKLVDFNAFKPYLNACYSDIGRPTCDPVVLFKMLLLEKWYSFLTDKSSSIAGIG